ncbi:hypothetical protein Cadr_000028635 [Camelus dromedarius]|uniref:Uncharacterized protein n=1 Tax=Camelus dromedarius TaxID=9838 RepID=A0A5N4CH30_CAMDR|nr:hypothetical protein Cadr_000028635 [Camelus dromedarius]KAB1258259.1 hypothetical protein Cadr_000028635 [Camelus dromedarius]
MRALPWESEAQGSVRITSVEGEFAALFQCNDSKEKQPWKKDGGGGAARLTHVNVPAKRTVSAKEQRPGPD